MRGCCLLTSQLADFQGRGAQAAAQVGLTEAEAQATVGQLLQLPVIHVADKELEAAHWIHCSWLAAFVSGDICLA